MIRLQTEHAEVVTSPENAKAPTLVTGRHQAVRIRNCLTV